MGKIPKHLSKPRKSVTNKSSLSIVSPLKSPKGIKNTPRKSVEKSRKNDLLMAVSKNLDVQEGSPKSVKKNNSRNKTRDNLIDTESELLNKSQEASSKRRSRSKSNVTIEFPDIDQSGARNILEKHKISLSDIKSAIDGVIKFHSDNPKMKNQLFDERFPLSLSVNCHKIPRGHPKLLRIPLKNSLLTDNDDVCLIASEVKGIGNKEHEKHIEHYEELFAAKGVTNIKKIMTFHEFRTEHETFEQKSRLVDSYEAFLVCGKISGKAVKKCGKIFYKKRKVPVPVKLQVSQLKKHIDQALCKSFFHLHLKGDSYNLQFGHSEMGVTKIMENVLSVLTFLDKNFPGGLDNIKGLFVYAPRSTSIPVFVSTKSAKEIGKVATNTSKNSGVKTCRGELTTLPNAEVIVKPSGQVIIKRILDENIETPDEKITDEDIIRANKEDNDKNKEPVSKKNKNKVMPNTNSAVTKKRKPNKEDAKLGSKKQKLMKDTNEVAKVASKKQKVDKRIVNEVAKLVSKKHKIIKDQGVKKASKEDRKKKRKVKPGLV